MTKQLNFVSHEADPTRRAAIVEWHLDGEDGFWASQSCGSGGGCSAIDGDVGDFVVPNSRLAPR
jgi:hypothetical protein